MTCDEAPIPKMLYKELQDQSIPIVNFSNFDMNNHKVRLQFTLPVFEALQSLNSKLADSFLVSIPRMNDNPCCQSMIQTFLIIFNCVAFVSCVNFFSPFEYILKFLYCLMLNISIYISLSGTTFNITFILTFDFKSTSTFTFHPN